MDYGVSYNLLLKLKIREVPLLGQIVQRNYKFSSCNGW